MINDSSFSPSTTTFAKSSLMMSLGPVRLSYHISFYLFTVCGEVAFCRRKGQNKVQ